MTAGTLWTTKKRDTWRNRLWIYDRLQPQLNCIATLFCEIWRKCYHQIFNPIVTVNLYQMKLNSTSESLQLGFGTVCCLTLLHRHHCSSSADDNSTAAFHDAWLLTCMTLSFLGGLFDIVDLIKPVSNVRPFVRAYMRTSVRPSTKSSSILMKFGI